MNKLSEQILTSEKVDELVLNKLFNDEICILRVPQYCSHAVCDQLTEWFVHNDKLSPYDYVMKRKNSVKTIYYGVDRVGFPYNSTYGDDQIKEKYYQAALTGIQSLRMASQPYLSPIDRLRVELDENWTKGANVANFEGKKMFVGIGRIMKPELSHLSELQPHWDSVPTQYINLLSQFSANIYLSVPNQGGGLEIWDIPPLPTSVIHENDPNRDWRNELPKSLTLTPEKGDLLMFNTRRPHAIKKFKNSIRVAVQCFIGINPDKSLSVWT